MEALLILHGAIGEAGQLNRLSDRLRKHFRVYTPHLAGHGGREMEGIEFSIRAFALDVLAYMDREGLEKVNILGYSMGGYVGMYLARHHSDKVNKIVTLATKYHWNPEIAAKEALMMDPEKIAQKIPAFADTLRQRHAPNDWKEVLAKTCELMTALGNKNAIELEEYASIAAPALLLLGDRDKMITLNETLDVYKTLPNASMGMLPGMAHPIEQADVELVAFMVERFLLGGKG